MVGERGCDVDIRCEMQLITSNKLLLYFDTKQPITGGKKVIFNKGKEITQYSLNDLAIGNICLEGKLGSYVDYKCICQSD